MRTNAYFLFETHYYNLNTVAESISERFILIVSVKNIFTKQLCAILSKTISKVKKSLNAAHDQKILSLKKTGLNNHFCFRYFLFFALCF